MFLNYDDFIIENLNGYSSDKLLSLAEEYYSSHHIVNILNRAEDGRYPHVQISRTEGCKCYIGAVMNALTPYSEVFETNNPKIALLALVLRNLNTKKISLVKSEIDDNSSSVLKYSIFPGNKKMTLQQLINKIPSKN